MGAKPAGRWLGRRPPDCRSRLSLRRHGRLDRAGQRRGGGIQADLGASGAPAISGDGRYVAFHSDATNLVPGDTNGEIDVFVYDRQAGTVERISEATNGTQGNDDSTRASISAAGRFVAFMSDASNLVAGDGNGKSDVFVHDRLSGATTRVSVSSLGAQGSGHSRLPSMSSDGRFVAFESGANDLVAGDTNFSDIFVHDRQTGTTERVSVADNEAQGNSNVFAPAISGDGNLVAFQSVASNLVANDTNATDDVFVRNRAAGTTTRVSVATGGTQSDGTSYNTAISTDGLFVAFQSLASNLVGGDSNGLDDVFVHDRQAGTTERVSVSSAGAQGTATSFGPDISAGGRFVSFGSEAPLVGDDSNAAMDVYLRDRQEGTTERVSVANDGAQGNAFSNGSSISADGSLIAFASGASNLVSGDTNTQPDIFVRNRAETPPADPGEIPPEVQLPQVREVMINEAPDPGGSAVLTVSVSDDTEAIEWDVNGDGKPEIVSEPGQTSFRFRPEPGQSTTVDVRATGPGGTSPVASQEVSAPPAPQGGLAGRILGKLDKRPPVYAVGPAAALTGPPPAPAACGSGKSARQLSLRPSTRVSVGQLSISGPMSPATSLAQMPRPELGIAQTVAQELNIPPTKSAMEMAVRFSEPYVGSGTITLNEAASLVSKCNSRAGTFSSTVVHPQTSSFANAEGMLGIAGALTEMPGGVLKVPEFKGGVASLTESPIDRVKAGKFLIELEQNNPELEQALNALGATLVSATGIGLETGGGYIDATITLPSWINRAGVSGQVYIRLDVRDGKVAVDKLQIGPLQVSIGVIRVQDFQVNYDRSIEEWRGQGKACFVADAACLDMIPPAGQIRIVNGNLEFAGAELQLSPGLPLGPAVTLDRIGFKFGLNPTRFGGSARVRVAGFVVIDGSVFLAFPSSSQPFVLREDEFPGYPEDLYGRSHTSFTIGLNATALLDLPVVGETELAKAYFVYEQGAYVAFGANFDLSVLDIASITGYLTARIDFSSDETIYLFRAGVEACLHFIAKVCGKAEGAVSRGRNGTGGAGVCFGSVGGGVQWPNRFNDYDTQVFLYPPGGKSCPITRFIAPEFKASSAQASAGGPAHFVRIDPGDAPRAIRLDGAGAPPRVRITGPGGQVLEGTSETGVDLSEGEALGIASFQGTGATADQNFTVVSINDPRPGRYEIELLEGSPAITKITEGEHPEEASARGEVDGSGDRRVLRYEVARRPGQRVTFYEVTADGTAKAIGSVTGGGSGRLAFTPSPGTGERHIEAQFEIDGLPAERLTLADFKPPAPRLAKPSGLRVRRAGTSLRVSWKRVPSADRYELALTMSAGGQRTFTARGRTTVLRQVPKTVRGRVSVRGVDSTRQGPPVAARFTRTAPPKDSFEPLPQCQFRQELVCRTR